MNLSRDKVLLLDALKVFRKDGKRLVFTNGCFDILHPGHITLLKQAKAFGDILIVGMNSDASVKHLKGDARPVFNEKDRVYMLEALSSVDLVCVFEEATPIELISVIQPDIHVKGGDYRPEDLPETETVNSFGGRVEIVPFVEGHSTSSLIEKLK